MLGELPEPKQVEVKYLDALAEQYGLSREALPKIYGVEIKSDSSLRTAIEICLRRF